MLLRLWWAIALAALPVAARAEPDMRVARSPHFQIYSTDDEGSLRVFAENLERYDGVLRRLTGAKDAEAVPLTIYVLADQEAVGKGSSVIGYYQPMAAGAFAVVPLKIRGVSVKSVPRIVLFHEYAHHFMLQHFPTLYSPWFIEGAAEFYSTTEFNGNMAAVGKPEPLRIRTLLGKWMASLSYLLSHGDRALNADQTEEFYARSWLLVHYLTLSPRRGGQINAYILARSTGQTEEQAFESTFHMTTLAMDRELKAYFGNRQLPFATVDAPIGAPIVIRPATAGEAVVMKFTPDLRSLQLMREELVAGVSTKGDQIALDRAASRNADAMWRAARKYPEDAAVQAMAAESELVAHNLDAARELAANAVRLQPDNARAHLVLAAVMLDGPKRDDPKMLAASRKEIVLANRAAPDDPMPLIAYYRSFVDYKRPPPLLAVQGLRRAYQLAPQDDQVRMMLATEEIKEKRYRSAAELLRSVAFAPHPGPRRDTAQQLLKSLPGSGERASSADTSPAPDKRSAP